MLVVITLFICKMPKDAPNFAKEKAFARLPSDEEWEFAARGGFNVY